MHYSIQHIGAYCDSRNQLAFPDDLITEISIDSRRIRNGMATLFVALKSQNRDGHQFIQEANKWGCRNFLVQYIPENAPEGNYLVVEDTRAALQKFADQHRQRFDIPVVGITGSNGKTIVKEWLHQIIGKEKKVVRSPGSYNSQIGVPLSVLLMDEGHEIGLFEAGISERNEMAKLTTIVQCNLGILTNIGDAHAGGFSSRQEKLNEKLLLFSKETPIIFCADDALISNIISKGDWPVLDWSFKNNTATYRLKIISQEAGNTAINLIQQNGASKIEKEEKSNFNFSIPFQDSASIENAIHAVIAALQLGISVANIQAQTKLLEPLEMRLSLHPGNSGNLVIQDYYNADLHGLEVALDFMTQQAGSLQKVLILSKLLGAENSEDVDSEIIKLINSFNINQFIGIGNGLEKIKKELAPTIQCHFFPDTSNFVNNLSAFIFKDSIILLKGSRKFAFERIFKELIGPTHRARVEIKLSALKHNLEVYKKDIDNKVKIMAMVKASAYGSGSVEISKWLQREKLNYLCVAYPDEGIQLRKAGIYLPIMVLNPAIDRLEDLVQYNLEPEVYNFSILQAILPWAKKLRGIHLKLDTGMRRLGFLEKDWQKVAVQLREEAGPQVLSIFTHLVASEEASQDDFTHHQAAAFERGFELISKEIGYRPIQHLLNTNGIRRFPQYQFDMVRLGLGLYGYSGDASRQNQLQPIFSLKGQLVQIKALKAGETVGYGRKGLLQQDTEIGVVNIGYADGLLRKAGNGRFALRIAGQSYLTIGNICMDMCMLDLGKDHSLKLGAEVTVFSEDHPIQKLAEALETITYEVLTNISARVPRIYIQD